MDAFLYYLENTDNTVDLAIGIVNFIIMLLIPAIVVGYWQYIAAGILVYTVVVNAAANRRIKRWR